MRVNLRFCWYDVFAIKNLSVINGAMLEFLVFWCIFLFMLNEIVQHGNIQMGGSTVGWNLIGKRAKDKLERSGTQREPILEILMIKVSVYSWVDLHYV